jgi:uncharacterized membrane protein
MDTIISSNDHWVIWTSLVGIAALSLYLEQKYKIIQKITGAVVAMVAGMILSNIGFLPTESASYDVVWDYVIPLVIPLLLLKMNIKRIIKETGRLFGAFHLAAIGTVIGSIIAIILLHEKVPYLELITPAMTGSYIGGAVNFVALVAIFDPPRDLINATIVADNGIMVIYFIFLIALPGFVIMRKLFPISERTKVYYEEKAENTVNNYWKPKPISLLDIAESLAIAFLLATLSVKISEFFSDSTYHIVIQSLLGQKYLVLTTLSIVFPLIFPKTANKIAGSDELGTFLIFVFFSMIGIPASIKTVVLEAPMMLIFCAIILTVNFIVTIILGKIFKYDLEELVLAAVVTSGGPMNGVAIAISKGWHALIVPSLLIGIWGYIIGNYTGYLMGIILNILF